MTKTLNTILIALILTNIAFFGITYTTFKYIIRPKIVYIPEIQTRIVEKEVYRECLWEDMQIE